MVHPKNSTTGGLKESARHRRALGAQQETEELGWRLGNCKDCSPNLAYPGKTIGREKSKTQLPSVSYSQEDQQNLLGQFKASRRLFFNLFFLFFPPSEKIRPGAVKGLESDPKRHQKDNPNN